MDLTNRQQGIFWQKVKVGEPNECWEWQAHRCKNGYGKLTINNKKKYSHRISYIISIGEIPEGMSVMHSCDNPSCVNPVHLSIGTQKENAYDRDSKGRNGQKNKTHCPKLHKYTAENTYISKEGQRFCRECGRVKTKEYKDRIKLKSLQNI